MNYGNEIRRMIRNENSSAKGEFCVTAIYVTLYWDLTNVGVREFNWEMDKLAEKTRFGFYLHKLYIYLEKVSFEHVLTI